MRRPWLWLRRHWVRLAAHIAALIPLGVLAWELATTQFIVSPVKEVTIRTGRLGITFLLLSLACTPVATVTGFSRLLHARRPLGLWALAFVVLHVLAFAGWDYRFDPVLLRIGIFEQPFVLVGLSAFLILLALGVTSFAGLQKSMGRSWRWLQRTVYLAGVLDVWHVLWIKKNAREAWRLPVILAVLLLFRLPPVQRLIVDVRKRITGKGSERQTYDEGSG